MTPLIAYEPKNFRPATLDIISRANEILREYEAQGFDLTLRQLYYQFVSRDWIRNKQSEYDRLGSIVNDARMAGRIDWHSITDRTRNLQSWSSWETPVGVLESAAHSYRRDIWERQPHYVECWIEKDALVGVIERPCRAERIPYFSCRGYTSQSEMWRAAVRLGEQIELGKKVTVLHLGDHDPSGIDMTRDIRSRLTHFMAGNRQVDEGEDVGEAYDRIGADFAVERIALTMDQIEEYGPPPNPAKQTDSRAGDYIARYGYESWELDALPPTVMGELIQDAVQELVDQDIREEDLEQERAERADLDRIVDEARDKYEAEDED